MKKQTFKKIMWKHCGSKNLKYQKTTGSTIFKNGVKNLTPQKTRTMQGNYVGRV